MSTTLKNFGFVFTLALGAVITGCAADSPANPTGGGSDTGGGGDTGGGDDVPTPLDATGKYHVQSTFDIASNMPGTVGTVVNDFIAATDDADDPTHWILDQIIAQMPNGTLKNLLSGAEPFVAGYLNDQLLDIAPDFVTTIVEVGNDFGDMAKHFGLNETFDITGASVEGGYTANVTACAPENCCDLRMPSGPIGFARRASTSRNAPIAATPMTPPLPVTPVQ